MATRLLEAGHQVACSSRSRPPVLELEGLGARGLGHAGAVVRASEVTFLALPDDAAVTDVVEDVLDDVSGSVLVDCSTVAPATERRLHHLVREAGGAYLDAPVSGGPAGAQAGTLAAMVGGDETTLALAQPSLKAFAARIVHVGPAGSGQVVKLCNQVVVAGQMLALCEAVLLAQRAGVEAAKLHAVLTESTGDCAMARTRFPVAGVVSSSPASNGWRADFTTTLMAKDLGLAAAEAEQFAAPSATAQIVRELLRRSAERGHAAQDWSAMIEAMADGLHG